MLLIIFWSKEPVDCTEQLLAVEVLDRRHARHFLRALAGCSLGPCWNGSQHQVRWNLEIHRTHRPASVFNRPVNRSGRGVRVFDPQGQIGHR